MDLKTLYGLRTDFTVIGLTGRTGSGCSRIAEILSGTFKSLEENGLRNESEFSDEVFKRKYLICKNFLSHGTNWVSFEIIRYVDVLLFLILLNHGGNHRDLIAILKKYYREGNNDVIEKIIPKIASEVVELDRKYSELIRSIRHLKEIEEIKADEELHDLGELFFSNEFKQFKEEMFSLLESNSGYFRTRYVLHQVSCNLRQYGNALGIGNESIENIFTIANLINKLIKAKRVINGDSPTKIVIDSLRNSLEIMFFKERYSAFYMVATKDVINNTQKRIQIRLAEKIKDATERDHIVNQILKLDNIEYQTKDFSKGLFSSPDVENCIQKSDFHIFNLKKDGLMDFVREKFDGNPNGFFTREEQLMKLVALIQHPGLITPSSAERAMQIANTAKLNSGCISRKVGAVITDKGYYIKSIGWNDIARGHTPCNLRSITDFFQSAGDLKNNPHYSPFEKGYSTQSSSYKYKGDNPGNFKEALVEYFKESFDRNSNFLNGKNCSFCFKTVHNHFEGEANQVHTRSLHAEENAMLQITKLGGVGAEGGFLFTTASPCELCAKKAYQLGIKKIFFIDPYPGIAVDQILRGGQESTQPKLVPFYGAIGNAYHELYDGFMSYKDEITMTLEVKPKQKLAKEIDNILEKAKEDKIRNFFKDNSFDDPKIIEFMKNAIDGYSRNKQNG